MITGNGSGRRSNRNSGRKKVTAEKTVLSSRFTFHKPTTMSSNIPIIVFKDTTVIEFEEIKACIISKQNKMMFLMNKDCSYYIIPINENFVRVIETYNLVILTSDYIYTNKDSGITEVPLFID